MRPSSRMFVYAGIAVVAVGFGLLAYTWVRVAALTAVPFQIPYLVSGGMTGLALILVGLVAVNIHVKLRHAARRDRQIAQLSELLDEIRVLLGGEEREPAQEDAAGEGDGKGSEQNVVGDGDVIDGPPAEVVSTETDEIPRVKVDAR